jgi:TetR/AcrR family transcriptional regulator, cholesterol catabolism regulator
VMEMRNEMHRYVRQIIEQGIADGHFDPAIDPGVATNSLFELLNTTVRWFRPTGRLSYEDLGVFYKTFVLRGLSPGPTR